MITYISTTDHYKDFLPRVQTVKQSTAALGSAILTGAGIGMKAETTRNFETGILTDDPEIVEQAMNQFDEVWIGKHCKACKRREYCSDPII